MNWPSDLEVMKLFSLCQKMLGERGISVVQTTQFESAECRARTMGKPSITPMLSSEFNDLSKDDAFWLFLQQDGMDMGCVAARRDNLASENLSEYWARTNKRYYGMTGGRATYAHALAAVSEIKGSVVYVGEFFIRQNARGSRNQLTLFTHLLFSYCAMKWQPDWIYAFVRRNDIRRGYGGEYGFNRQIPGAQIWPSPPPGRQSDEYLVALTRTDLFHMAEVYCRNPDLLLSSDSLTKVEKINT